MVVAVDHAALGVGGVGIRVKGMAAVVHNSKVGIVACHPLRRGAVRCQHHVEPHRQAVLGREVEHRVVVVEVVRVARRLHPVPVRCAAHDSKPRRPDVGEVLVPALRFGRAAAIVFDADRERRVGVGEPLCHVLSPPRARLIRAPFRTPAPRSFPSLPAPADLPVPTLCVQLDRRHLLNGRIQNQRPEAQLGRALLQCRQHLSAQPPSLDIRVLPHSSYLGPIIGQPEQGAHSDDAALDHPYVELTSRGEVLRVDTVQIVVPGAVSPMGVDLVQRNVVELPNGVMVRGEISANLHHSQARQPQPPCTRCRPL